MNKRKLLSGNVHIIGRRSYLAGILDTHMRNKLPVRRISATEFSPDAVQENDVVVNCTFSPALYDEPVTTGLSSDGKIGAIVADRGARYVMLSSRTVYSPRMDPPLTEDEQLRPMTVYGQNKATIEASLKEILGERLLILRIGNVFGGEPPGRRTFVSTAIASLMECGIIELNLAPATHKDFIPASFVGQAAAELVRANASGVYNVSSGIPLTVGEVADALIKGFGSGDVRITSDDIGEEFLLDTAKLRSHTNLSITRNNLLNDLENTAREYHR